MCPIIHEFILPLKYCIVYSTFGQRNNNGLGGAFGGCPKSFTKDMGLNSDGQSQSSSSDVVHKGLELNWMGRRDNEDVQQ